MYRIEVIHPHKEALRRAFAVLARPQNAMTAARLAWRAADRMWRIAGDTSTDFNHYSKRGILSALYTSTMLVYLDDDSDDLVKPAASWTAASTTSCDSRNSRRAGAATASACPASADSSGGCVTRRSAARYSTRN